MVDLGKGMNAVEFTQLTRALQSFGSANYIENDATTNYPSTIDLGVGDLHA